MAQEQPTTVVEPKEAPLWPTAVGLTVLVLGGVFFVRSIESGIIAGAVAVLAAVVTVGGVLFHGMRGLWSLLRGRRPAARGSLVRAIMYLVFGIAAFAGARSQGGTVEELRSGLEPGMSAHEVLRRLDRLYAAHPDRYRSIALWGGPKELSLEDYGSVGKPGDAAVTFTWSPGEARSKGTLVDTAAVLAKSRQVWFTFSTDAGFVRFFVVLDDRGLVESVSRTISRPA